MSSSKHSVKYSDNLLALARKHPKIAKQLLGSVGRTEQQEKKTKEYRTKKYDKRVLADGKMPSLHTSDIMRTKEQLDALGFAPPEVLKQNYAAIAKKNGITVVYR